MAGQSDRKVELQKAKQATVCRVGGQNITGNLDKR